MTISYQTPAMTFYLGSCLDVMRKLDDASIDAIVTDPPYGLGFMGKAWDDLPPGLPWAQECLRVLKPGGHLLAFGGSRTWHRLAVAIEDAGFEMRDSIAWLYGSGFPKSLDVSKAIDKTAGHWRGRAGEIVSENGSMSAANYARTDKGEPVTDAAKQWQGWGTALKPAFEPIVVGRKPIVGTVAANVQAYNTGALNIDACRTDATEHPVTSAGGAQYTDLGYHGGAVANGSYRTEAHAAGRWPTNVVMDATQAEALGDPARFFPTFKYQAKAPQSERPKVNGIAHPTVKPVGLMRWLVKLVTPPGGLILDPFLGTGATAEAAAREGFSCVGIENDETYMRLALRRVEGRF